MGTNYYLVNDKTCDTCGQHLQPEQIHIGKQSAGWKFLFAPYSPEQVYCFGDWVDFLMKSRDKGLKIMDEYGKEKTLYEFLGNLICAQYRRPALRTHHTDKIDSHGYRFSKTWDFS